MVWIGRKTSMDRGVDGDVGTRGHSIGALEIVARDEIVVEI